MANSVLGNTFNLRNLASMKANPLLRFLLLLVLSISLQVSAQQSEADRKLFVELRTKAQAGDAQSQVELARTFSSGKLGVIADEAQGMKWFRKAAEQNSADAQHNLGDCYYFGKGTERDYVEAVKWLSKAAEQNQAEAQNKLGFCYAKGQGVAKDQAEAVKWYRRAAEQNLAVAQNNLGLCYSEARGVTDDKTEAMNWLRKAAEQNFLEAQFNLGALLDEAKDYEEAVKWYSKAAVQDHAAAQNNLANCYYYGQGVAENKAEAAKWFRRAAEQGLAAAQYALATSYANGTGVVRDYIQAYKWSALASAQGVNDATKALSILEKKMTPEQTATAQELARNFRARKIPRSGEDSSAAAILQTRPEASGTGFFITDDGYLITNAHVVQKAIQVRLVTETGIVSAVVAKVDVTRDLALLKVNGIFEALPIISSRSAKLGCMVATIGFPNIGLQGFAPKLAKGEIASLSGAQDDPRYFQISVPVQPGNSGGPLVDERGNVVGLVAAKLSVAAAVATSGALPENVNYAVKSSFLLSFLESVPEVSSKLKEPSTIACKFEDVVKSAERAAVLVLVY